MSRLWDTPEFWIRSEADEVLRDCPTLTTDALADRFEQARIRRYGDPEFVRRLVRELRMRAYARVRFWPDYACTPHRANAVTADRGIHELPVDPGGTQELEPAEASNYWWQRI